MKYKANPIIVEAYQIIDMCSCDKVHCIKLENGQDKNPSKEMLSRINPVIGDYWVIQEDGYEYINPKSVFERKYSKI